MSKVTIRPEEPGDIETVHLLNVQAFGQPMEARIVDTLRERCRDLLSLVAVTGGDVVGHILFSCATIEQSDGTTVRGMGLAPMAVLPEWQRKGIGSKLVEAGLEQLGARRRPFVIVIGHAEFYPRFGFEPASKYDVHSEWAVPDEAFMIRILDEEAMRGVSGLARYRPEFAEAG